MLPGSQCDNESICYHDRCVATKDLDSSAFAIAYETDILDLAAHCSVSKDREALQASNTDPHAKTECINWEDDFLCESSRKCPAAADRSIIALYINHVCCAKCVSNPLRSLSMFSRVATNSRPTVAAVVTSFVSVCFLTTCIKL